MQRCKKALVAPVALATLALVGCGGGSDNNAKSSTPPPIQAGQVETSQVLVDGVEVQKTTYRYYSVSDNKGALTDVPLANATDESALPHVLITDSVTRASAPSGAVAARAIESPVLAMAYNLQAPVALPSTVAEYKACYAQFWQGIQKHYPTKDKAFVAKRLSDFNMNVDELCVKQASSNLSMDEYIEMFQVVLKYWPNDLGIDGKIAEFFMNIEVTPGTFKQTLTGLGYTWEDFARRASLDSKNMHGIANAYILSGLAIEPFLRNYMAQQQPGPIIASFKKKFFDISVAMAKSFNPKLQASLKGNKVFAQTGVTAYTDAANAIVTTANNVFKLGKDVWTFIDQNKATVDIDGNTPKTSILASADAEGLNYEFAKNSTSSLITFKGTRLFWTNYQVDMLLQADYGATNKDPAIGGQWVPNFGVVVKKVQADAFYSLTGSAKVSNLVNRASAAAPVPEAEVALTVTATNVSVNKQTFTFSVNGASGAAFKF